MNKKDYYEVLGVSKQDSDENIKKSYRRLAMKFHPDRVSSLSDAEKHTAENKFKELQEAYSVLSDPQKKQIYDQYGHKGLSGMGADSGGRSGFGGFGGFSSSGRGGGGFEDIFEQFGDFFTDQKADKKQKKQATRGGDIECSIEISLEDASHGIEKEITFPRRNICSTCHGQGTEKPNETINCKTCKGHGQVRFSQGFFTVQQDCPDCHGAGKMIKHPCSTCRGSGSINENKKLKINIPAGVSSGQTLKVSSEGNSGSTDKANGDLYIHIHVQEHKFYERKGLDLHCEVPISFITAILGGEIEIPTIDNKLVKLKIPEGTQTNTTLRVKGKGVPSIHKNTGYGDLYCHIYVEIPINLTAEQKTLLKNFEVINGGAIVKQHPRSESFIDKLKHIFH